MNYEECIHKFLVEWWGGEDKVRNDSEWWEGNNVSQFVCDTLTNLPGLTYVEIARLLNALSVKSSSTYGDSQVSFYPSLNYHVSGKRVTTRFGRLITRVFPNIDQKLLTEIVSKYNEEFSVGELIVRTSMEKGDFSKVYSKDSCKDTDYRKVSSEIKSLSNSCMAGTDPRWGARHPAEVYGSGDFTIYWAEDAKDGRLASRCVVWTHRTGEERVRYKAGPIYTTSQQAVDKLRIELDKHDWDFGDTWSGARLNKIEARGRYLMPYLDYDDNVGDEGSYYVIGGGEYSPDGTTGFLDDAGTCLCCLCDCRMYDDDVYNDNNGDSYCESCWNDNFAYCEHCGESYNTNYLESTEVHISRISRNQTEWWCDNCVDSDAKYVESLDETCIDDNTYICVGGDYITTWQVEDGDYVFPEDDMGTAYPIDDVAMVEEKYYSVNWLTEQGYTLCDDGEYRRPLEILMEGEEDAKVS